jgi:hypothetical protein
VDGAASDSGSDTFMSVVGDELSLEVLQELEGMGGSCMSPGHDKVGGRERCGLELTQRMHLQDACRTLPVVA